MSSTDTQTTPALSDLFGFDVPTLNRHFPSPFEMAFTLEGDNADLERLKRAAHNAQVTLHDGIEAISDLLLTVELNCHDEVNRNSRADALALIIELSVLSRIATDTIWRLDRTKAEPNLQA